MHNKIENVRSAHKTMGIFTTQQAAEQAMQYISNLFAGDQSRLALIEPEDPELEYKLKNEYSNMGQAAISIHIWSIVISVLVGVGFWGIMYSAGVFMFVHEFWISLMGSVCVFLLIGIIIGVLVAYTPSRNNVIIPVTKAVGEGKWVVISYPNSKAETKAATEYFEKNTA